MPQMNMVQAINDALRVEMRRDDRVVVLGEDVGKVGGVFRVTQGLFDEFGEDRVIDTPLSENGIIGCAIGMALYGLVPVPEIQFSDFIWPAYDQIVNELAKYRYRSGGEYSAKMVIRTPVGGGIRGGHYHSQHPEAPFIHVPGLKVVCPSNPYDAKGLLLASLRDPDPVIFFEPKRVYRAAKGLVPEGDFTVPIGAASVAREGKHVTVIAYGAMLYEALDAATKAAEQGVEAEVIDLRTLWPVDIDTVIASVKKTGRLVVVHEAPRTCGLGAELVSLVCEKAFYHLEAPPVRVTGFDTPFPYTLELEYLPLSHRIVPAILGGAPQLTETGAEISMSRFEFKLPDIGEGVTEGEIVGWHVRAGDAVVENQDMVEVMTDKATVTIGAPKQGTIVEVRGSEGDVVPVGSVLVVLDVDGDATADKRAGAAPAFGATAAEAGGKTVASAVGDLKDVLPGVPSAPRIVQDEYHSDKPLASPATRKLARELGVDLSRVRPTGEAGRVTREDVEQSAREMAAPRPAAVAAPAAHTALTVRPSPKDAEPAPPMPPPPKPSPVAPVQGEQRIPIRGLRKRIYENMARAKHTAAHFTYVDECDVSALRAVRERTKVHAAAAGVSVTYLPYIVKAVVASLRRHPTLNAVVDDAAMEIVLRGSYDVGIAVATDAGLMVPVVRGADRLSILELAQEIERLGNEARAGKTRREDLGGSSFTITSLGKQGGLFATPVVNYPEVAILGVHQIKRRPVVRGDEIVIGDVMLLSLSFDHRIIDGHVGAAFATEVISYLEAPERLLLEMR